MRRLLRLVFSLCCFLPVRVSSRLFVDVVPLSTEYFGRISTIELDGARAPNTAAVGTATNRVRYVSATGDDSNDGLSWSTAKKTLSLAVAELFNGGTIYLTGTQTIFSHLDFSADNLRIYCKNGGTLAFASGTGHYITWSGKDQSVRNCVFKGPGGGSAIEAGGDDFMFEHNTVTGLPFNGGNGELTVYKGSHDSIAYNDFYDNSDWDIEVNNASHSQSIADVRIVGNHAGEIIAHTTARGSQIEHLFIADNVLRSAQNHKTEFCVEVGAFGGLEPNDISVTGNSCTLTANGADGGFSMSAVNQAAEWGGNVFDAGGFTYTIAPFEDVVCSNCVIVGNVANDGVGGDGISIDRSTTTVVFGNRINGFVLGRYGYGIHVLVCNSTSPSVVGDVISTNRIVFPKSGNGRGIWQQCDATGAICKNNKYVGNTVISDGAAGSIGISIENDLGETSDIFIRQNHFKRPETLISHEME